jgi:carboxyl-terminal processing protease
MPARRRPLLLVVLAVLVGGLALVALGVWLGARHPDSLPGPIGRALAGPPSDRVVEQALDEVDSTYYRRIPRSQLRDDAIAGIVAKLNDRFSNYFSPAEYRRFKDQQGSTFTGVGITVSEVPRGLRVEKVFAGSPAKGAGMLAGDVITTANGHSLKGLSTDAASALIKGPVGTNVQLTFEHQGRARTETLVRSPISVPVVASALREVCGKKVGIVALSQFSSGAHAEVYAALQRLKARGAQAFVFDLRENGGGLVDEAQLVASAFLPDGKIVTTRGRNVPTRTLNATGEPIVPKAPLVVLVDRGTASAAEIVAGALQDRGRAKLVGTRTFGKGVFQEVIELSNGGALDITAGQYFTPRGRNLGGRGVVEGRDVNRGVGLRPDIPVAADPKGRSDVQLQRALDSVAGCTPARRSANG